MKNIHILPTDKPSRLYTVNSINKLDWSEGYLHQVDGATNQNLYITSDESLKQGEENLGCYYLHYNGKIIKKNNSEWTNTYNNQFIKKIILTTDQDLIKDGVQAIDDEFLEWFVKNPSCEFVEVKEDECGWFVNGGKDIEYRKYNYIEIPKEEPKQETLEEAKSNYTDIHNEVYDIPCANLHINNRELIENAFEYGAKWQQEQDKNKYSEELIQLELLIKSQEELKDKGVLSNEGIGYLNGLKTAFKQFKNK
jgi:hypothetical protein